MLVSPRNIFALGEAGDLPRPIAAVHRAFRTPHVAIIVYAVLSWLLTITGTFKYLLAIFVIARMLVYGSTAAALIVLRRREGPAPVPVPGGVVDLGARPRRLRRPRRDAVVAGRARRRHRRPDRIRDPRPRALAWRRE